MATWHAVNPGKALAALAHEGNWPIWHWHVEKAVDAGKNLEVTKEIRHLEEHA
jgi:hypothetical protein